MNIFNLLANPFKRKEPELPYPTGHLVPSPTDLRDIPMSAVLGQEVGQIPLSYKEPYVLTQKNQGQTPECAVYTGSTVKEEKEHEEGNTIVFDQEYLWKQCKLIDGLPPEQGTYFRVVMSVLKNIGALPMGGNEAEVAKYRIGGYVQVDCTPEAIRRAIYTYGAILMGFKGSNGGWMTGNIRAPKAGEIQWGHAVCGIGYDEHGIIFQNSWGEQWGNAGKGYAPDNYLPFECWAVVKDLPDNLLPNPTFPPHHTFTKNLFYSMRGQDVRNLQECLVFLGCMKQSDMDTGPGIFGMKTLTAVKLFQLRYGIPQTGAVYTLTLAQLNKLFQ